MEILVTSCRDCKEHRWGCEGYYCNMGVELVASGSVIPDECPYLNGRDEE